MRRELDILLSRNLLIRGLSLLVDSTLRLDGLLLVGLTLVISSSRKQSWTIVRRAVLKSEEHGRKGKEECARGKEKVPTFDVESILNLSCWMLLRHEH